MILKESITNLNGIGAERETLFNKIGIYTIEDLIMYYPRDYQDRDKIIKICECEDNTFVYIKAKIMKKPEIIAKGFLKIIKTVISDSTGNIEVVWFNKVYLKNALKEGNEYIFWGKVYKKLNKLTLESPEYQHIDDKNFIGNSILPIYKSTKKLSQKMLRNYIKICLDNYLDCIEDYFEEKFLKDNNLCTKKYAIKNIHFPENKESFFIARRRLVFEELFFTQLSLYIIKGDNKKTNNNFKFNDLNIEDILEKIPFKLTNAQNTVLNDIIKEISNGNLLYKLIQGDVGSGKTILALILSYLAIKNGYQSVIMAPTEILATQHFESFKNIFDNFNINTVFLTSGLKKRDKLKTKLDIEQGNAQMVVGTHSLIQEDIKFNNLAMVITDEQHRFSVKQRNDLFKKGCNPHMIIMSATPIPRTLGLILYGDLDISIVDELPPGRQKIETYYVNSSYRERFFNFILKELDKGRQAYIVCPAIDESDDLNLNSVIEYTKKIKDSYFKNYRVEFLHGKMKSNIKQEILRDFYNGSIQVIVSTTVIEVGINVPNATIMLIENAERFGLAQLHQLRGRIGRGKYKSYCILVTDSKSKVTKERMKAMISTDNGFKLSELDLKLRGPGDFFGTKQHGIPDFKIANLYKDIDILKEVQKSIDLLKNNKINFNKLKDIAEKNILNTFQL